MAKKTCNHRMKCWLDENDALVDYSNVAPAPCKDFYHVFVTSTEVIWRSWPIKPPTRPDSMATPSEIRNSYDDFVHDEHLHSEIQRLAGDSTLKYLTRLAKGFVDYFPRLPDKLLMKIVLMLDLEDLARLSSVSKPFRKLCNCEELWEQIYRQNSETLVPELEMLAIKEGWKRLFFTNKLQLQMQLRRQKRHDDAFITEQIQQKEEFDDDEF